MVHDSEFPTPATPSGREGLETTALATRTGPAPPGVAEPRFADPLSLTFADDALNGSVAARSCPRVIGRYRVLGPLGEGGFGKVYLARDDDLYRSVAVKVPHFHRVAKAEDVQAYLDEARAVASLDHPHIVPVHDTGRDEEGFCFVVSKYIEGSDLAVRIREGRLTPGESAGIVATMAEALHHAHSRGLVHRDVKPANILLDVWGQPHLTDFGLALRDEDFGRRARHAGTPAYMSPEQARGEGHRVDGRCDVFSLGAVFYELLTGRMAFTGTSREELLGRIIRLEVRPPRQIDDAIPREVERICLKAMAKRAADRYNTALDMADDLRQYLKRTPEVGFAPPSSQRDERKITDSSAEAGLPRDRASVVPKGLRSFDDRDADFFLNLLPGPRDREGLPETLRFWKTRIESTDPNFAFKVGLIYGPSGCGKSSMVKAGLLPRLGEWVRPVYIEATPEETESRLALALSRMGLGERADLDLAGQIGELRRGRGLHQGRKLLVVIDQFEQWLLARGSGGGEELVAALRQCDGERVQALVMVRDDFWLAASRFMKDVEIRLVEGENAAMVDLFDADHARRVLAAFGRAYGILPERHRDQTAEQKAFLDSAVAGLSQDGKVVPVRLALFAEMTKSRPWSPATLKAVGGTRGVGVAFLEETFAAGGAPPEHRLHRKAAQAVLKSLLPQTGSRIKGEMRSEGELREIAGYEGRPEDFDALIRILDRELRLMTPTDAGQSAGASESFYQLTHDYLVQPLEDWLTRKERETRRGRAALRLAERASDWSVHPGRRWLLSAWELLATEALTRRRLWSAPERALVRASWRHHAARGLVAAAAATVLALTGAEVFGRFQASSLRDRVVDAATDDVPAIVPRLSPFRRWLDPMLAEEAQGRNAPPESRRVLNARLALLPADPGQVSPLTERMLMATPRDFLTIRAALRPHREALSAGLWTMALDAEADPGRRLRATCALADFEPDDPRHGGDDGPAVPLLLSQGEPMVGQWVEALRPLAPKLVGRLTRTCLGSEAADDRYLAACALADYLRDDPDSLLPLALRAEPRQLGALISSLAPHAGRVVPTLLGRLREPPGQPASDADRARTNAVILLLRLDPSGPAWAELGRGADLTTRTRLIHELGPARVGPELLARHLDATNDPVVRQAIALTLGETAQDFAPERSPSSLVRRLLDLYRGDPDPGVHSAAGWALRRAGRQADLQSADRQTSSGAPRPGWNWFANPLGMTLAVIPGPAVVRGEGRESKPVTIPRSYAIGTTEVTRDQYRAVLGLAPPGDVASVPGELPAASLNWYDAARFCRRLSEREGLPEDQMAYPPLDQIVEGMTPYPDYLKRRGYRLPTEAEWIHACRAGSTEPYFFGRCEPWLSKFAWTVQNAEGEPHKVASLKPNRFGLFDTLGNLYEWCEGPFIHGPAEDREAPGPVSVDGWQRGGAYDSRLSMVGLTTRNPHRRVDRSRPVGFRVARTCD